MIAVGLGPGSRWDPAKLPTDGGTVLRQPPRAHPGRACTRWAVCTGDGMCARAAYRPSACTPGALVHIPGRRVHTVGVRAHGARCASLAGGVHGRVFAAAVVALGIVMVNL